jgi:putative ABC transport system permease protein
MLGIIIGVSSVVLLISIGRGLESYITDQFDKLGTNNIYVSPGQVFSEEGGFSGGQSQMIDALNISFDLSDVDRIKKLKPYVVNYTYYNSQTDEIKFLQNTEDATLLGSNSTYNQVIETEIAKGRFFNESEADQGEKVVILGHEIYKDLFGEVDPIGKKVHIGPTNYEVIGVAEEVGGSFGGPSFDTYVYMPYETMARVYDSDKIYDIVVKSNPEFTTEETIKQIEQVMEKRYEEDEFSVFDQSEILSVINNILGMLTIGLGGIAAISLVVGGVGIMNIMLVSVTERTKEIGLRKALGATPNLILAQFLIEAALLSVLGGLIGLGIAYLGSLAIQPYFPAKVTMDAVLLSFGVSTAVGLVFGAAPARRASKLSPIEALRYE